MKYLFFFISFFLSLNLFGQKAEIEQLINQVIKLEVPNNFEYYCLVSKSLTQGSDQQPVDWRNFDLENVRYLSEGEFISGPETIKDVYFYKYNIPDAEYDSILKNKKPKTLHLKKRWYWNKKRIWKEVVEAWKEDEEKHIEEQIFYSISKPVFSDDGSYAKVSILKQKKCKGIEFTGLYRNENGTWIKEREYDHVNSVRVMTHSNCGEVIVAYKN
ncbi:hypothetical protein [Leeuwenhoekiella parthenopeia]|uniref:Uncharacterized protein n=1 Tax=Leeuwenhoekiella parthenopeia TaxID=2890320 RepID=A0ABS8GQP8_9FLAO|nr:hypothetical protein [Leeuwenhoekiella parthenopeia]MCC4212096.1 hypothetical protein [Leeuwenhoekiella parthenopeia]